ncbi:MAG: MarR family winged helix-turn-helix transcriptional regulator [Raineya sp.]|jgi:DNA-binding MarR family transcriptional regulator|nr:MarR family winged helix-turn-helix transcriptional regulator [Raineya sp.]
MNYSLLKTIVEQLELYEQENKDFNSDNLTSFVLWLNKKLDDTTPQQMEQTGIPLDGLLMAYISNLYKYVKHYAKKIFENTIITGIDDFVFLMTIRYQTNISKSELIQQHLLEISSGMEILKRLQKEKLVEEVENEGDKRKKSLQLTNKGSDILNNLMPELGKVATLASANLENTEKIKLLNTLKYLDDFHKDIYHRKNFKNLSVEEILKNKL